MGPLGQIKRVVTTCIAVLVLGGTYSTAFADAVVEPNLIGKSIVIDAGHGGKDSGARSAGGLLEKDITLSIALNLSKLLSQAGAKVALTRTTDTDLATERDRQLRQRQRGDLKGRVNLVHTHQPDLFISIHCNAVPSPTWHGAQTLYQEGNAAGKQAATLIQQSFQENLIDTTREPQSVSRLYVLRKVHRPAVLAEVGFLSNPAEAYELNTETYQERVAMALYVGILSYFNAPKVTWWEELRGVIGRT